MEEAFFDEVSFFRLVNEVNSLPLRRYSEGSEITCDEVKHDDALLSYGESPPFKLQQFN